MILRNKFTIYYIREFRPTMWAFLLFSFLLNVKFTLPLLLPLFLALLLAILLTLLLALFLPLLLALFPLLPSL